MPGGSERSDAESDDDSSENSITIIVPSTNAVKKEIGDQEELNAKMKKCNLDNSSTSSFLQLTRVVDLLAGPPDAPGGGSGKGGRRPRPKAPGAPPTAPGAPTTAPGDGDDHDTGSSIKGGRGRRRSSSTGTKGGGEKGKQKKGKPKSKVRNAKGRAKGGGKGQVQQASSTRTASDSDSELDLEAASASSPRTPGAPSRDNSAREIVPVPDDSEPLSGCRFGSALSQIRVLRDH